MNRTLLAQKARLLQARRPGLSFGEAQLAVLDAERHVAAHQVATQAVADRGRAFAERRAQPAPTPAALVGTLRQRAREIQAQTRCDLGTAQRKAEQDQAQALSRLRTPSAVLPPAKAASPPTAPAATQPGRAPAAFGPGMPVVSSKRILSVGANDDDPPFLMVMNAPDLRAGRAN